VVLEVEYKTSEASTALTETSTFFFTEGQQTANLTRHKCLIFGYSFDLHNFHLYLMSFRLFEKCPTITGKDIWDAQAQKFFLSFVKSRLSGFEVQIAASVKMVVF
jgi:hypothetical protein